MRGSSWRLLLQYWRRVRANRALATTVDACAIVLLFLAISSWQSRSLLPVSEQQVAPQLHLTDLQGRAHDLHKSKADQVVVYFFAPWCRVCKLSAGNLQALREARSSAELEIYLVALSYGDRAEVEAFATRHKLTVPVLLGNELTALDWRIKAFPTYYVIDGQRRIRSRSMGYSTEIGLRFRA